MTIRLKNAKEFKRLLMEKGYSYRAFAKVSKVAFPTISDIANEKKFPTPQAAKKITEALGLEFNDLFFIE
jgi:transcriptional regulator with XRE-family HTH domain